MDVKTPGWSGTYRGRSLGMGLLLVLAMVVFLARGRGEPAAETELRWGGDAEGGAPFVEADPNDPAVVRGFDVEVAEAVARGLSRRPRFIQVAFTSIPASVGRGDLDIGLSGVEEAVARRAGLLATVPYYEFREVLSVRAADAGRLRTLADLRGRRVGTLGGTLAFDLLTRAQEEHGVVPVSYDDDVHPYSDLAEGRLDAVLLDHVIAGRAMSRTAGLVTHPQAIAVGHYVGVLAPGSAGLRDRINQVLLDRMRDGALEGVYRRWGVWDEGQRQLFQRLLKGGAAQQAPGPRVDAVAATLRYLPALLGAAMLTLLLSCLSMLLAVLLGGAIAVGRVYGGRLTVTLLTAYVELMRGTPVLLQLFVLYYGLSSVVRLPAFVAAFLGLGLNYAAYESEVYRNALQAVPAGQLEAARVLGLRESQILRLIRGPQAFRLALAPMINDFVALLKDSSLVSAITVIELTKQTAIFAANIGSWALPGALCAALYLALSLPLSRLALRLEAHWKEAHHS